MLCGLLHADAGSGTCLGHDVIKDSESIKMQVGYMTQRFSFYEDLSIAENLDFVARMYGMKNRPRSRAKKHRATRAFRPREATGGRTFRRVETAHGPGRLPDPQPKLLLLDEPTAGVDPKARRDFWEQIQLLAAQGLTFLITTHYMDEAERCNRLAYISYGNLLIHGTVAEVIDHVGLTTWSVHGPDLIHLAEKLRQKPGVEQAVVFGTTLHVSGDDAAALEAGHRPVPNRARYQWEKIPSALEDVFIHLMDKSKDNFSS